MGYQFGLVGNYILQDDLVNGKHYWIKENGAYGIWYTDRTTNAWMVGSIGNLGKLLFSFFLSAQGTQVLIHLAFLFLIVVCTFANFAYLCKYMLVSGL